MEKDFRLVLSFTLFMINNNFDMFTANGSMLLKYGNPKLKSTSRISLFRKYSHCLRLEETKLGKSLLRSFSLSLFRSIKTMVQETHLLTSIGAENFQSSSEESQEVLAALLPMRKLNDDGLHLVLLLTLHQLLEPIINAENILEEIITFISTFIVPRIRHKKLSSLFMIDLFSELLSRCMLQRLSIFHSELEKNSSCLSVYDIFNLIEKHDLLAVIHTLDSQTKAVIHRAYCFKIMYNLSSNLEYVRLFPCSFSFRLMYILGFHVLFFLHDSWAS